MQVCGFFLNTRKRKRDSSLLPPTSSPTCPRGQTIPSQRTSSPALQRPDGDNPAALSQGVRRLASWAPRCHLRTTPPAALPARRSDGNPADAARTTPASLALSCFWNAGGEGRASWGISAPARPPAHGPRPGWPRSLRGREVGSGIQPCPNSELTSPTPLTGQERERQQQPVEHRAEHVRLHARRARGVRPGSLGSRSTKGLRGASGVGAPWLTGLVAARAARGGQDPWLVC